MKGKKHSPEQVIAKLRQAERDLADGFSVGQVCQKLGISEQTFARWQRQYGGMEVAEAKRLRDLEAENSRLKRLVADLSLVLATTSPDRRSHRTVSGATICPATFILFSCAEGVAPPPPV